MTWLKLLNEKRRKNKAQKENDFKNSDKNQTSVEHNDTRTEIERDYDRILFSTPVRRLADKTQVFPLDRNDSVRTRLTHSHEVSNLARSIGNALVFHSDIFKATQENADNIKRNIPSLLAAIGLAHDLGNPPFGHQGEAAIRYWFDKNQKFVFSPLKYQKNASQYTKDFLAFEGNAQTFRLVTRLQLLNDDYGLNLTYATLAALLKYPVASDQTDKNHASKKKHGFFASEQYIVEEVHKETGLSLGRRHALTYIMEACDDIAYAVLDAEDTVKKGLASFSDLIAYIESSTEKDTIIESVKGNSLEKYALHKKQLEYLSPPELNDISMQYFRVYSINEMMKQARKTFILRQEQIINGNLNKSLLDESEAKNLCEALKKFSFLHAYRHRSVLEIELRGHNIILDLMDFFWAAIRDRENDDPKSRRQNPFTRYVYERISKNYRRIFENPTDKDRNLPLRYRECLLLTDMISGMTDSFAIELHNELLPLKGNLNVQHFLQEAPCNNETN